MAISRRKKLRREEKLKAESLELKRSKKFATKVTKREFKEYVPQRSYVRVPETIQSYSGFTNKTESTARRERKEYTGEYITGLATMHKSNIVPVGKGDDPKNYATMRRN